MVERYLIEHCAPTLASLKAANLFNYPFEDLEGLNRQIEVWNDRLQKSGVRLCLSASKRAQRSDLCIPCQESAEDIKQSGDSTIFTAVWLQRNAAGSGDRDSAEAPEEHGSGISA